MHQIQGHRRTSAFAWKEVHGMETSTGLWTGTPKFKTVSFGSYFMPAALRNVADEFSYSVLNTLQGHCSTTNISL